MIAAAAACPHPPLLFRELTGEQDVAAELRAACHAALTSAIAVAPDVVVVVGGDRRTASWDPGLAPEVRGFGTTDPRPVSPGLPLSLGVASRLLVETGWHGPVRMHAVACDAGREEVDALAAEVARFRQAQGLVRITPDDRRPARGRLADQHEHHRAVDA